MSIVKDFTIYTSYGMLDLFDIAELEKGAKDYLIENGCKEEDITDEMIQDVIFQDSDLEYACEYNNLDKTLDSKVLAIADLGFWNGRRKGYKVLSQNLNSILNNLGCGDIKVFVKKGNVKAVGTHHDGTHYITYRKIKPNVNIDKFLNMIYNNEEINNSTLNYYTTSLAKDVAKIYGLDK